MNNELTIKRTTELFSSVFDCNISDADDLIRGFIEDDSITCTEVDGKIIAILERNVDNTRVNMTLIEVGKNECELQTAIVKSGKILSDTVSGLFEILDSLDEEKVANIYLNSPICKCIGIARKMK